MLFAETHTFFVKRPEKLDFLFSRYTDVIDFCLRLLAQYDRVSFPHSLSLFRLFSSNMVDFIFVNGAPGAGKSSVCGLIQQDKSWPSIDFGCLRVFHLDRQWSNASAEEEQMSFENLIFILKNYHRYGYKNVLVNDLKDERLQHLSKYLPNEEFKYLLVTLAVSDDEILKLRVLEPTRDSGFRNYERAIEWNRILVKRELYRDEVRLDNTNMTVKETADRVLEIVDQFRETLEK
jgi:chloramphenicol 3-O-phosphotransferase